MLGAFQQVSPAIWFMALAIVLFLPALSALRWRLTLAALEEPQPWRRCLLIIFGIYPVNLISPARLGDLLRVYALRREVAVEKVLASVVAERAFDVLALAVFCFLGGWILKRGDAIGLAASVICAVLLAVLLARNVDAIPLPKRIRQKLITFGEAMRGLLRLPRLLCQITALAGLHWFLAAAMIALFFQGVGATVQFSEVLAYAPIAILIGLVPVSFGGIGTRDAAIILMFSNSATPEQGLAVGILYTFFAYCVLAIVGLPFTRRSLKL